MYLGRHKYVGGVALFYSVNKPKMGETGGAVGRGHLINFTLASLKLLTSKKLKPGEVVECRVNITFPR
jgi:hypothetical protein